MKEHFFILLSFDLWRTRDSSCAQKSWRSNPEENLVATKLKLDVICQWWSDSTITVLKSKFTRRELQNPVATNVPRYHNRNMR